MKGYRKTGLASMLLLLSFAVPAVAGIKGSMHDFSESGWAGGQICTVCHAPHNGATNVEAPLWNHAISSQNYILYDSPSLSVYEDYNVRLGKTIEQPQPGSISRMCLSCHDGTVALDSFGGATGSSLMDPGSRAMLGTDLRNDHPIGISWDHQHNGVATGSCDNCHEGLNPTKADAGKELKFFNGKVECATCHDVHNVNVMDVKLLRKPLAGSALCQHCHMK